MNDIIRKLIELVKELVSTLAGSSPDDGSSGDDSVPGDDGSSDGGNDDGPSGLRGKTLERTSDGIGDPISGVELTFTSEDGSEEKTVTSDANGDYSVQIPEGRYVVTATHPDYADYSSTPGFFVVTDGMSTANVFLEATVTLDPDLIDSLPHDPGDIEDPSGIVGSLPDDTGVIGDVEIPDVTVTATEAERYTDNPDDVRTTTLDLPEPYGKTKITYEVADGLAIIEGDMILGSVDELEAAPEDSSDDETENVRTRRQGLIAKKGSGGVCQQLWSDGVVPVQVPDDISSSRQNTIQNAFAHIENNSNVQFVDADGRNSFIDFEIRSNFPGAGASKVGKQGGSQELLLKPNVGRGTVVHELLHAMGVWHEQSRNDRNRYVEILWDNIRDGLKHNFEIHSGDGLDIGQYDYGSIMHYPTRAFGESKSGGGQKQTIDPKSSGVTVGQRSGLSTADIAGLRTLYPYRNRDAGGHGWGSGNWTTDVAFGDVDGDGRDEVGIARKAGTNMRFEILSDDPNGYRKLYESGESWGSSNYATSIAFGDVDGDGRDEVGIARKAGSNARYWILDDATTGFETLHTGGDGWGSSNYATSIAFGDVDGDGRDEVVVGRSADENDRFWVLDDANAGFAKLHSSGEDWGYGVASVALGDVDGDGVDEVGVARDAGKNARFIVYDSAENDFVRLHTGGKNWGNGNRATSIAFGDVDGDGRDEVGVARDANQNARYFVFDDFQAQFDKLHDGGRGWGSSYHATDIAFGDVDGDGREEIGVTRYTKENARFWLVDDSETQFDGIDCGGYDWGSNNFATSVGFGNTFGNGNAGRSFAIGRHADINGRYFIHDVRM